MSAKLPSVSAQDIARVARRLGFALRRQRGSHAIYKRADGARVVIPMHGGHDVDPSVVRAVIRDMGITVEEFCALL